MRSQSALLVWPPALGELAKALGQLVFLVTLTEFRIPWEMGVRLSSPRWEDQPTVGGTIFWLESWGVLHQGTLIDLHLYADLNVTCRCKLCCLDFPTMMDYTLEL